MEFLEIINAQYTKGYCIEATFNNGEVREMDFSKVIEQYPVFKILADRDIFKNFTVTDTLEWNDGAIDIAPEYFYDHSVPKYNIPEENGNSMVAEE